MVLEILDHFFFIHFTMLAPLEVLPPWRQLPIYIANAIDGSFLGGLLPALSNHFARW